LREDVFAIRESSNFYIDEDGEEENPSDYGRPLGHVELKK